MSGAETHQTLDKVGRHKYREDTFQLDGFRLRSIGDGTDFDGTQSATALIKYNCRFFQPANSFTKKIVLITDIISVINIVVTTFSKIRVKVSEQFQGFNVQPR